LLYFTTCYPCKIKSCYFHFQPPVCSLHYYLPATSLFNTLAVTGISGGRLLHQKILVGSQRVQTIRRHGLLYVYQLNTHKLVIRKKKTE
jgi:hypothetical protein